MVTESYKNGSLTEKQMKAIPVLISSQSYSDGCRKARISRKTLYEWFKDRAFKNEIKRQRDIIIEEALDSLKGSMVEAVTILRSILSTTNNETLKRYLAKDIIEYVLKVKETEGLEKRVSDLEEILHKQRR